VGFVRPDLVRVDVRDRWRGCSVVIRAFKWQFLAVQKGLHDDVCLSGLVVIIDIDGQPERSRPGRVGVR
jgi:hypothetical protein